MVGESISIVIAGNKIDLETDRNVEEEEVLEYAKTVNATHFYTSAKRSIGLDDLFSALTRKMIDTYSSSKSSGGLAFGQKFGAQELIILSDGENAPQPNLSRKMGSYCCG
eukprot:CAMPEP_0171297104 /NCGR_PEP_ID=MMETSP0816-20121228/5865_1 /TAXON_ID=420281 /ORGANISM="Proboscia inermis, Strain CCAP1064/1" /LENGTH=109 /DNA_ID=CAMNT_0011771131 /DNA_START=212 /DNA_END=541 /DNA_ORIENTATION=+